mmetsp:Transcript_45252/g.114854  ORF Transcript_45252/g.114854 Transcript_45252/m.114854 type:complete len:223 (-) Transcript_45252:946-1614(-)
MMSCSRNFCSMCAARGLARSLSRSCRRQNCLANSRQSSPSRNSMYRLPSSVSTSKTMRGSRSSKSSSRSSDTHAALTSPSAANLSRWSLSTQASGFSFNFSISRSFFCSARTRLCTASLSPKSMIFGFGPFRFGPSTFAAGQGGGAMPGTVGARSASVGPPSRSLISMRSPKGSESDKSMRLSLQKRRANSRQLSPTLPSSRWLPQADVISQTITFGSSTTS